MLLQENEGSSQNGEHSSNESYSQHSAEGMIISLPRPVSSSVHVTSATVRVYKHYYIDFRYRSTGSLRMPFFIYYLLKAVYTKSHATAPILFQSVVELLFFFLSLYLQNQ